MANVSVDGSSSMLEELVNDSQDRPLSADIEQLRL